MNSTNKYLEQEFKPVIPDIYFKEPHILLIFRLILEVSMASVGVVGNVLVIVIISARPQLYTVVNNHIRNLAVADLSLLIVTFPLAVIKEQDPYRWPLGEIACLYIFPLCDVFYGVSVWSITAIAVDRYRAIVWGCRGKRACYASIKSTKSTIAAIWFFSFLVICLPLFFVMDYWEMYGLSDCTPIWPNKDGRNLMQQFYFIGTTAFWYILPLLICLFAYVEISRKIRESSKFHEYIREERHSTSRSSSEKKFSKRTNLSRRERHNTKAMKILTPVVLVFAATAFPGNAFRFMLLYYPPIITYKYLWVLYNVVVISLVANSSLNPVIYSIVSEEFRRGFKSTLARTRSKFRSFSESLLRQKDKPTSEEVV